MWDRVGVESRRTISRFGIARLNAVTIAAESSREAEGLLRMLESMWRSFTEFVLGLRSDLDEICDHTHLSRAQIHETKASR